MRNFDENRSGEDGEETVMKLWRYWIEDTRPLRCRGASGEEFELRFRVVAGSCASESEAKERMEAIFAELADGE